MNNEMILLTIYYEGGLRRRYMSFNEYDCKLLLHLMFDEERAEVVYLSLKRNNFCIVPYLTDKYFKEHLFIERIDADFHYQYPMEGPSGQERNDPENLPIS